MDVHVIECQNVARLPMDFRWWVEFAKELWTRFRGYSDMEQSKWVHLPDVVIIEIFKYLKDVDKVNMALTCKNWCLLYHTPCLWRSRSIDIGGYRVHSNGVKACQFADLHGKHVKYLSLCCSHPSYHTARIFQKTMEDLLIKMRHSNLIDFELERLELDRFWKFESARDRLITNFVRFFKSQTCLKSFDMTAGQFPAIGGTRILESVGQNSGSNLQELYIEDFFHSRLAVFQIPRFVNSLSLFKNTDFIALNYNCISEEIIELFAKNLSGKLECMNIKVYRHDPRFHRISGNSWRLLKTACPDLRITFWFESIGHANEIIPILVKEIPVRDFHIWTGYDDDAEWRLNDTIYHLMDSYRDCIESVSLEMDNNHELIDDAVLRLVVSCKELRDLTLNATLLTPTIERILALQYERKIRLKTLRVTACGLTENEWEELSIIKENYSTMITERGLDFKLSTDLIVDIS